MLPALSVVLAILGGQAIELPAAVLVEGRDLACTGALVAPDVVLSAAHCLEQEGPFAVDGVEVAGVRPHPDYSPTRPGELDLLLLYLTEERPEAPLVLGDAPPLGSAVRHVGLGLAEGDSEHVLRASMAEVANLFDRILATEELDGGPCHGDSGGPVLDEDSRLVAVTSFTPDCDADVNGSARVDVAAAWIEDGLVAGPPAIVDDPSVDDPPVEDPPEAASPGCEGCAAVLLPWFRRRRPT